MNTLNPIMNIKNILLLKSVFSRNNQISGDALHNDIHIDIKTNINGNNITFLGTTKLKQTSNGNEQASIEIVMVAQCEKIDKKPIEDQEKFGKTIGASIIFPYMSEQITSTFFKAGIPVILPQFDFMNNK